jgi:hypothetical protein
LEKRQATWRDDEPTSQFDVFIHLAMLLRIHSHTHNGQIANGPKTRLAKFVHIPILRVIGVSVPDPQRLIHGSILLHHKLPAIHRAGPLVLHILHDGDDQLPQGLTIHSFIPAIHA